MLHLKRRYPRLAWTLLCAGVWLALCVLPAGTQVGPPPAALLWTEEFDGGLPATWTVQDRVGGGATWTDLAGAGLAGNYTGGQGDAAAASSDAAGPGPFDTALHAPPFTLPHALTATLTYRANVQAMVHHDRLDLDVSTDGGASWTTLRSWNEDHGGFRSLPGEDVTVDLTSYLGRQDVRLRWRYYDLRANAWDHYVQVDDVAVTVQGHDLRLTRRGAPQTAPPGGSITYTLIYTNAGAPVAEAPLLQIDAAACLTDVRVLASQQPATPAASGPAWTLSPLAPGARRVLTVGAQVRIGTTAGASRMPTATLTAPAEGTPADNRVTLPLRVQNVTPLAQADVVTATEDVALVIAALDNDRDLNGDPLALTGVGTPQHGAATVSGTRVLYQPAPDYAGPDVLTYTTADPDGSTAVGGISITVEPVNDAPTVAAPGDLALYPGASATVPFTVADVDDPASALQVTATLTNAALFPPGHWTLVRDGAQCTLTLTSTATLGEGVVRLAVSDGELTSRAAFAVRVAPAYVYLPVVAHRYDPRPDLRVQALTVAPDDPAALQVTVENVGDQVARYFWVDLYLDPAAPPAVNQPWTVLCHPYGAAWFVAALPAGETLSLTIDDAHYQPQQSRWPARYPAGEHAVWAYVDSWGYPQPWGGVREAAEDNNRYGPVTFTAVGALSAERVKRTFAPLPPRPRYPEGGAR
jgi:hypothetical protein